jgi:hypothetical protein
MHCYIHAIFFIPCLCHLWFTLNATHHSRARETMLWLPSLVKKLSAVCGLRLSDADCSEATETDETASYSTHRWLHPLM